MDDYKISRLVVSIPPAGRNHCGGTIVENQSRTGGGAGGHLSAGQRGDLSACALDPHPASFPLAFPGRPPREVRLRQALTSPHAKGHDVALAVPRGVDIDARTPPL